jgi:hypothetical protein
MNKKLILPISLMLLVGLVVFVSAARNWEGEVGASISNGWNLVYGLAEPSQLEAGSLEPSHIKAIYAFIPQTQEYFRMWPSPSFEDVENLKSIISEEELAQTAFWVYSDKTVEGELNGMAHGTEYGLNEKIIPYNERAIYQGWNFIGVTLDMRGIKINDAKGDCNILKICDYARQNWDCLSGEDIGTHTFADQNSDIGKGLVIKVSDNCKLGTIGGNIPPAPELP